MKGIFTAKVKSYKDSRFEQKGVELQMDANTWWQAKRSYEYSCMLCCTTGVGGAMRCAQCPIRAAMLDNAMIFRKRMPEHEWEWVKQERELR